MYKRLFWPTPTVSGSVCTLAVQIINSATQGIPNPRDCCGITFPLSDRHTGATLPFGTCHNYTGVAGSDSRSKTCTDGRISYGGVPLKLSIVFWGSPFSKIHTTFCHGSPTDFFLMNR